MSNDLAKLINGPADEKIVSKVGDQNNTSHPNSSWQKPFNCPINGCTKSFTRHRHLSRHISRHVQSCQSKRNRKENEKPVHPPSPVTSCLTNFFRYLIQCIKKVTILFNVSGI